MRDLEERIKKDGKVFEGNILKVDSFLNHQIDIDLLSAIADDFYSKFAGCNINKILTIEASGIAMAAIVAERFACPLVFAKKSKTSNLKSDVYSCKVDSFTHNCKFDVMVSKDYLCPEDTVLIIDDFLALGNALKGLIDIVKQSGASLAGCGIAIEKGYQGGGDALREQGYRIESMAIVESMDPATGSIVFRNQV